MANKKIISETFIDAAGRVVDDVKDAVRIEVIEELPNGKHETTILTRDRAHE
jgi:hypothetical protein